MTAMPDSTVVRVPKAGEMVAAHVRRQIVTGALKVGDALPSEAALMERYGISRPTLREAFRILESERVITVRRGARGGARVMLPDAGTAGRYVGTLLQYMGATLADVYEARMMVEASAVEMVARKRTAAGLGRLEAMLVEGEQLLDDPEEYIRRHDLEFHRLLAELAGNETTMVMLDILFSILECHNEKVLQEHRDEAESSATCLAAQRSHAKLIDLIRAKDADKAVSFWRRHLTQVTELMISDPGETVLDVLP
ncbi:GntR family transcriptional regulator [Nocardia nova]|uniref:GntR family transcriptional regulator n=1 Tax=Nocardia nova TaxID=37330 RepID=A0A2S6AWC9_9NOCA|nr:FCD domain-containing protein [Nocardia nova]PPJ33764.1 GntR family transcriptional regulator [Nocardia nova]PPJ39557.1 GntR family transcriptional regulator [Nocardia nova]